MPNDEDRDFEALMNECEAINERLGERAKREPKLSFQCQCGFTSVDFRGLEEHHQKEHEEEK